MENGQTSPNRTVYVSSAVGASGSGKPHPGYRPLCGFVSATVWAGVNASHCLITCLNCRKPKTLSKML